MNVKSLLFFCAWIVGSSACMGSTRPAPDTSPLPDAASIAEHSAVQARRLEAERRSGVIFETSRPGRTLVDGQPSDQKSPDEKAVDSEPALENEPEDVPSAPVDSEQPGDSLEETPGTDPEPVESQD